MVHEPSDEDLMYAYVAGDHHAFERIFRRHAPWLHGRLRRSNLDANDLVQQTFLQLHRARNDFKREGKLRPWLYSIALNCMREQIRRRARRFEQPLTAELEFVLANDGPTPEGLVQRRSRRDQLQAALTLLPAAERQVIEMHWFEDRPFAEVARLVGASLSAVKVRAHRGYARLRARLGASGA